jgi:hypothetical protein
LCSWIGPAERGAAQQQLYTHSSISSWSWSIPLHHHHRLPFFLLSFFCFIFDLKSSGSISLFVNIELFCIFQTRKRESFLPPLCIDLPLVYKSKMRVYLLFPDMCQRHFCRRYIISCVCVADRAIRPGRFLYFSRPTE